MSLLKSLIRRPHKELHRENAPTIEFRKEWYKPKPRVVIECEKPVIKQVYYNGEPIGIDNYIVEESYNGKGFTIQLKPNSHPKFRYLPAWDYSLFEVRFVK